MLRTRVNGRLVEFSVRDAPIQEGINGVEDCEQIVVELVDYDSQRVCGCGDRVSASAIAMTELIIAQELETTIDSHFMQAICNNGYKLQHLQMFLNLLEVTDNRKQVSND